MEIVIDTKLEYQWWNTERTTTGIKVEIPKEHIKLLKNSAVERAKEMVTDGYLEGELCTVLDGTTYTGWWKHNEKENRVRNPILKDGGACACHTQIVWFFDTEGTIIICKKCERTFAYGAKFCLECGGDLSYYVEDRKGEDGI
jgi:hypothetical protein